MAKRGQNNLRKRNGVYYIDTYIHGRRVRKSLETSDEKEAKRRRDTLLGRKAANQWGAVAVDISLDDLRDRYTVFSEVNHAPNTTARILADFKRFREFSKAQTVREVTAEHVELFKAWQQKKREHKLHPTTINDSLARLSMVWGYAIKFGWFTGANVFHNAARLKRTPPKLKEGIDYLTAEQLARLLSIAKSHSRDIHAFIALCSLAGLRTAEAAACRWEWVDFDKRVIHLQDDSESGFQTKDREERVIPLRDDLAAILRDYWQRDGNPKEGYVIQPNKRGRGQWRVRYEPRTAFATVKRAAQVAAVTPHKLRHTFASLHAMNGTPMALIAAWLGHSETRTTAIYAHISERHHASINAFQLPNVTVHPDTAQSD